ncbi:hypothetical protein O3M35_008496 [Rhynocoris fuscipes]|uniref:Odorant receptor n=1 Tax=Rhynocoris fuscipes TaxID=488301 RepID=A0AAW1DDX2_9HEMI
MIIIYTILIAHLCFFIITTCLSTDDFMLMTQSFNYTVLTVFFSLLQLITIYCKNDIKYIHEIIGNIENIYENDSDENIKKIKSNYLNFKRKIKLLIPLINIACGIFVLLIGPILNTSSDNQIYNESGVNFVLPVNIWYPFEVHEGINFFIGCIFEALLVIILLLFLQSIASLYVTATIYAALHLELLKYSIKTLEIRSLKLYSKLNGKVEEKLKSEHLYNNENFMNCMDYCLKINVKHHCDIIRLTKHINRWAKYPLPMTVGLSALMVALSGFLAISVSIFNFQLYNNIWTLSSDSLL